MWNFVLCGKVESLPQEIGRDYSDKALEIRAKQASFPSNSIDSNSGGEIVLPVVAIRSAVNAIRGLSPNSSINDARSTASMDSWFHVARPSRSDSERFKISLEGPSEILQQHQHRLQTPLQRGI